jgi:hypothetical protein
MSDDPELTPEERVLAAIDRTVEAVGKWMANTRESLQPFLKALEKLAGNPDMQARVRERAEEDGTFVTFACDCQCAEIHPDAQVCDLKAVTTIRRGSGETGPVVVRVCAPCAAEVMAQPQ